MGGFLWKMKDRILGICVTIKLWNVWAFLVLERGLGFLKDRELDLQGFEGCHQGFVSVLIGPFEEFPNDFVGLMNFHL